MRAFFVALAVFVLCLGVGWPDHTSAQTSGSLFPLGTQTDTTSQEITDTAPSTTEQKRRIEELIRAAAAAGTQVIVIDTDGNPIDQPGNVGEQPSTDAATDGGGLMKFQEEVVQFRTTLIERLLDLPVAFNEVLFILRATSPDGTILAYFKTLYLSLLLLAAGVVFERLVYGYRFARHFVRPLIKSDPQGYSEKMPFLVLRFGVEVVGILVSMLVAYILGIILFGSLDDVALQITAGLINGAYFLSRFVAGLWRMILSPFLEQYRIPPLETSEAKRLYRWLLVIAVLDIWSILFGVWIADLGLNYDVYAFLYALMSAVVVLANIVLVLVNRRALALAIRNRREPGDVSWIVRNLSYFWAPFAILYLLFAWGELTYELVLGMPSSIPLIAGAYIILMSIIVVYGLINFAIERSFARARRMREINMSEIEETDEPSTPDPASVEPKRMSTFEELARRVAGILAFVAGIYAFFHIWESESTRMVESYADRLLDVMVIMFLGYIVYHAFRIWIDTKIAEEQGDQVESELGDEGGGSSASRLATLLPLFRNFILIVLMVTIVLIILLELGINVGPLFAGAGVVGVAVGFGSQALVRDIFSGGFFLFDDAFRKGEYIDVGGVKGTVEKISVRSFQLRHHLGALHTIPFGEIQVMTNYSRDWVIMKLPLRVTYDTDVEQVRRLIKKLGISLLDDPVIGDNFIQPLKSQGVIEMQDSAMIIRVKFMTKPGDQWLVRKKVYEEIRALFEREGIKFAHREVTVRLADGKAEELSEEDKKTVLAAAQSSIEEELLDPDDNGDDR